MWLLSSAASCLSAFRWRCNHDPAGLIDAAVGSDFYGENSMLLIEWLTSIRLFSFAWAVRCNSFVLCYDGAFPVGFCWMIDGFWGSLLFQIASCCFSVWRISDSSRLSFDRHSLLFHLQKYLRLISFWNGRYLVYVFVSIFLNSHSKMLESLPHQYNYHFPLT